MNNGILKKSTCKKRSNQKRTAAWTIAPNDTIFFEVNQMTLLM